jgi:uncharacterized membrane protein YphA (DoxX/SURF4 family)
MTMPDTHLSYAAEPPQKKSPARYLPLVARILMGLLFFVFGLNGFLNFIPPPKVMPEGALAFFIALVKTGYMIPLIKGTEVAVGALLLSNRFVPLALVLIAPNIVNIILFHAFLEPAGLPIAGFALVLELFLVWSYRKAYGPMFAARATPA